MDDAEMRRYFEALRKANELANRDPKAFVKFCAGMGVTFSTVSQMKRSLETNEKPR